MRSTSIPAQRLENQGIQFLFQGFLDIAAEWELKKAGGNKSEAAAVNEGKQELSSKEVFQNGATPGAPPDNKNPPITEKDLVIGLLVQYAVLCSVKQGDEETKEIKAVCDKIKVLLNSEVLSDSPNNKIKKLTDAFSAQLDKMEFIDARVSKDSLNQYLLGEQSKKIKRRNEDIIVWDKICPKNGKPLNLKLALESVKDSPTLFNHFTPEVKNKVYRALLKEKMEGENPEKVQKACQCIASIALEDESTEDKRIIDAIKPADIKDQVDLGLTLKLVEAKPTIFADFDSILQASVYGALLNRAIKKSNTEETIKAYNCIKSITESNPNNEIVKEKNALAEQRQIEAAYQKVLLKKALELAQRDVQKGKANHVIFAPTGVATVTLRVGKEEAKRLMKEVIITKEAYEDKESKSESKRAVATLGRGTVNEEKLEKVIEDFFKHKTTCVDNTLITECRLDINDHSFLIEKWEEMAEKAIKHKNRSRKSQEAKEAVLGQGSQQSDSQSDSQESKESEEAASRKSGRLDNNIKSKDKREAANKLAEMAKAPETLNKQTAESLSPQKDAMKKFWDLILKNNISVIPLTEELTKLAFRLLRLRSPAGDQSGNNKCAPHPEIKERDAHPKGEDRVSHREIKERDVHPEIKKPDTDKEIKERETHLKVSKKISWLVWKEFAKISQSDDAWTVEKINSRLAKVREKLSKKCVRIALKEFTDDDLNKLMGDPSTCALLFGGGHRKRTIKNLKKTLGELTAITHDELCTYTASGLIIRATGTSETAHHKREGKHTTVADRAHYSNYLEIGKQGASAETTIQVQPTLENHSAIRVPSLPISIKDKSKSYRSNTNESKGKDQLEVEDAAAKITGLVNKYPTGSVQPGVYRLLTSLNRWWKRKESQHADKVIRAAHESNRANLGRSSLVIVQNIPINGSGRALSFNNGISVLDRTVMEATLMAELGLLSTLNKQASSFPTSFPTSFSTSFSKGIREKIIDISQKVQDLYKEFLKESPPPEKRGLFYRIYNYFFGVPSNGHYFSRSTQGKKAIQLLREFKNQQQNDPKVMVTCNNTSLPDLVAHALYLLYAYDKHLDKSYGTLIQALSNYLDPFLLGCKSANERYGMVAGRSNVLLSIGQKLENHRLTKHVANPHDEKKLFTPTENDLRSVLEAFVSQKVDNKTCDYLAMALSKAYGENQLYGSSNNPTLYDNGPSKVGKASSDWLRGFNTNQAEVSDVGTLNAKNASKIQAHKEGFAELVYETARKMIKEKGVKSQKVNTASPQNLSPQSQPSEGHDKNFQVTALTNSKEKKCESSPATVSNTPQTIFANIKSQSLPVAGPGDKQEKANSQPKNEDTGEGVGPDISVQKPSVSFAIPV